MNSFYKKNDIGVLIEYTIVGTYLEDDIKYTIYTDFVEDKASMIGLRLFVAKYNDNNELVDVDAEKKQEIIKKLYESFNEKLSI